MTGYEFTGAKWGAPIVGKSGGQVTWSFANLPGSFYSFDATISQGTYQNLIRDAFHAWESIANIDFIEVADSVTSKIRLGWDSIDGRYNTVGQAKYSFQYGTTFNQLQKSEIRFDTAEVWSTATSYNAASLNFYAVAVHEIGHALGLGHTDERDTIMFPSIGTQVALSAGDIAGARALYGGKFVLTEMGDIHVGTSADDVILGKGGNDNLTGGAGNDQIDGGVGLDTAKFAGKLADFYLSSDIANRLTVVDIRAGAPEGSDTLTSIERLEFSNGTLAFDFSGVSGQAFRLYQAAFDRVPDTSGLGYWIRELDGEKGDLAWVANNFVISEEFKNAYGSPSNVSNSSFLTLIYNNVLGRTPDQQGFNYWMAELTQGFGRERVLASFSESNENQANVIGAISQGIWYN